MCRQLSRFWQNITIDRLPASPAHLNTQLVNAIIQAWSKNSLLASAPATLFAAKIGQLGTAIVSIFRTDIHPLPTMVHAGQGLTALAQVIVAGMMLSEGLTCSPTDYLQICLAMNILDPIYDALLTFGSLVVDNSDPAATPQVVNQAPQAPILTV